MAEDLGAKVNSEELIRVPCTVLEDAVRAVIERETRENYPFPAWHKQDVEAARTYAILANQVPGFEKY